jgi:GNAT superfamily N-acetyltransferase
VESKFMAFNIRKGEKADCPKLLELINELAVYEKAAVEVEISVAELEADGFGENAIYDLFVAEYQEEIIGIALFYEKYSTWKGRSIYLEDLIVTQEHRGNGAGKALFNAVAQEAKKRNSGRMEWQVLDWNQSDIEFYEKAGAELDGEWINCKYRKEDLQEKKFD